MKNLIGRLPSINTMKKERNEIEIHLVLVARPERAAIATCLKARLREIKSEDMMG